MKSGNDFEPHYYPLIKTFLPDVGTGNPLKKITSDMDGWETGSSFDPLSDPEERQVIFAALDSFR